MNLFVALCASLVLSGQGDGPKIVYDPRLELQNLFAPSCDTVRANWRLLVEDANEESSGVKNKVYAEELRRALLGYYVRHFVRDVLRTCELKPADIGETDASLRLYEEAYRRKEKRDKERERKRNRDRRADSSGDKLACL